MRTASSLKTTALIVLAAGCAADPVAGPGSATALASVVAADEGRATGTHLVSYRAGERGGARATVEALGGRVVREMPQIGVLQVAGLAVGGVGTLATSASVAAVAEDREVFARPLPRALRAAVASERLGVQGTDQRGAFFYPVQWNIRSSGADRAWGPSGTGAGKLVCILDTGIDPQHLDLAGNVDPSMTISGIALPRYASDVTPLDYDFHGTFIAGLVASNGIGVASVAPDARLCSIKVLSEDGRGTFADILFGILQAADWNADAINLSLGAVIDAKEPIFASLVANMQAAVDYANARGSLVVAAAGNLGVNFDEVPSRIVHIPSMLANVVSVGATAPFNQSSFDRLASYSNHGGVRTVDIVAPGGDLVAGGVTEDLVISACSQYARSLPFSCTARSFVFASGTSFASPLVAAAAAVVESANGNRSPAQHEACFRASSQRVGSRWMYGAGRLDVAAALACP
ncbi:MAG: S8 family serine peptidase [Gemmatimonadetes bacterium]|nr:S8 family serine peptidase [Gemmatimonadota bacterium]